MSNKEELVAASTNDEAEQIIDELMMLNDTKKLKSRLHWVYAPAFLFFWVALFMALVVPIFFHLPEGHRIQHEASVPGEFIAERAERILVEFDLIGPKVVGSFANENRTVQLLHNEIAKIRNVMHHDLFELEVDVQQTSGAYVHFTMVNMYQGVQNFVVKFSSRNETSQSYLLINSHFDTKPGSPGAGDDGAMVVIMLEILRVLATTRQTFKHPIVFLFNGAEENPLQAAHGFITQHKWAKNCKALINLDSAGSGNREILFQSGPNHPWLMKYYGQHVKRPYATSLAEELFQSGILPSDTDFRIFKNHGQLPGLDFAHTYNGYVYHTEFDKFNVIPRGTLQATGDNILALTRGFGNSTELEDPTPYAEGHTVFYDFIGLFFIYYTETQSKIINTIVVVATFVAVGISLWRMAKDSDVSIVGVLRVFLMIFALYLVGFILAIGLPFLMAVLFDSGDRSMTWFTHKWLIIGLFICPCLLGLSAPSLIYISLSQNNKICQPYRLQMILHSHAIILGLICIITTYMAIRTSYLFMISILFYCCTLIINILTCLHGRGYYWTILLMIGQVMPFLYFSSLIYAFICTLIPMMGRFGNAINPDFYIAILCILGAVLAMGFLIPLLGIFRRPKMILTALAVVIFIFSMMALTYLGFPYRAKTQVGRYNVLHTRRVFYEYNGAVSRNESGYYFDFQDRRMHHPIKSIIDLSEMQSIANDCDKYMMCGLPVFNQRWYKARYHGHWLPTKVPVDMPYTPTLTMLSKTVNTTSSSARFEFELSGPPHMSIFLGPLEGVTVSNWSFLSEMLENQPPYHIFFSYGNDNTPLRFFFDVKTINGQFDFPVFELGISAHFLSFEHERTGVAKEFIASFPDFVHVMEWPSSYERYIF